MRRKTRLKKWLEHQWGRGPDPSREIGAAYLRGATPALTVFVHVDTYLLAPVLEKHVFSNTISIDVLRPRPEGYKYVEWARPAFRRFCETYAPLHAYGCMLEEFNHKNMFTDGHEEAIGIDVKKYLPGLYWQNYFGKPYVELIGEEQLLTAPAPFIRKVKGGVWMEVHDTPSEWDTLIYRRTVKEVIAHLGPEYFFDRFKPQPKTYAPAFPLPPAFD